VVITLSIDEKVVERARQAAQTMGKSLNEAVREYVEQLAGQETFMQRSTNSAACRRGAVLAARSSTVKQPARRGRRVLSRSGG
jgi:hypothetical protein